jgi:hypothetical protein
MRIEGGACPISIKSLSCFLHASQNDITSGFVRHCLMRKTIYPDSTQPRKELSI